MHRYSYRQARCDLPRCLVFACLVYAFLINASLKGELVDVVQLDTFHDQQPNPRFHLGDDRFQTCLGVAELEDVEVEALLVHLVALGVPFSLLSASVQS